jgi:hypothetical protein
MDLDIMKAAGLLGRIKNPLTLGGLALMVFAGVTYKILGLGIFPQMTTSAGATFLMRLLLYVFVLALICVILGIASYVLAQILDAKRKRKPKL